MFVPFLLSEEEKVDVIDDPAVDERPAKPLIDILVLGGDVMKDATMSQDGEAEYIPIKEIKCPNCKCARVNLIREYFVAQREFEVLPAKKLFPTLSGSNQRYRRDEEYYVPGDEVVVLELECECSYVWRPKRFRQVTELDKLNLGELTPGPTRWEF